MNYQLIKQVISELETFEQQTPAENEQTLANFSAWLGGQVTPPNPADVDASPDSLFGGESPETLISIMVSYLYRYTRLYSKKALEHSQLTTIDEFVYLVMLLEGPPPTKSELIDRNIHEKTTGIEVLRRLLAYGLIEQFDDPDDRRSKRLKLTDRGRAEVLHVMPFMRQVATLVGGNLSLAEKIQLVHLLNKLHLFHNPIFIENRHDSFEKLTEKVH